MGARLVDSRVDDRVEVVSNYGLSSSRTDREEERSNSRSCRRASAQGFARSKSEAFFSHVKRSQQYAQAPVHNRMGKAACQRTPRCTAIVLSMHPLKTECGELPYKNNDNDQSFSQHHVHKALTCPENQSAWVLRSCSCAADKDVNHSR